MSETVGGVPDAVCQLFALAGLEAGKRILGFGLPPLTHGMAAFDAALLQEWVSGQAFPVPTAVSSGVHADDTAVPDAFFDAIVALNYYPAAMLTDTVDRWRRLLNPAGGVAIITGTDLSVTEASRSELSQQLIDQLEIADFRLEVVRYAPTAPRNYAAFAESARLAAPALRAALGTGAADSYLAQVNALDRSTRCRGARQFQIIARLTDER